MGWKNTLKCCLWLRTLSLSSSLYKDWQTKALLSGKGVSVCQGIHLTLLWKVKMNTHLLPAGSTLSEGKRELGLPWVFLGGRCSIWGDWFSLWNVRRSNWVTKGTEYPLLARPAREKGKLLAWKSQLLPLGSYSLVKCHTKKKGGSSSFHVSLH